MGYKEESVNRLLIRLSKGDTLPIDALTVDGANKYVLEKAEGRKVMLNNWGGNDFHDTVKWLGRFGFVVGYISYWNRESFGDVINGGCPNRKSSLARMAGEVWREALLCDSWLDSLRKMTDLGLAWDSFFDWDSPGKMVDLDYALFELVGMSIVELLADNLNGCSLAELRSNDVDLYHGVMRAVTMPVVRGLDLDPEGYWGKLSESVFADDEAEKLFYRICQKG